MKKPTKLIYLLFLLYRFQLFFNIKYPFFFFQFIYYLVFARRNVNSNHLFHHDCYWFQGYGQRKENQAEERISEVKEETCKVQEAMKNMEDRVNKVHRQLEGLKTTSSESIMFNWQ